MKKKINKKLLFLLLLLIPLIAITIYIKWDSVVFVIMYTIIVDISWPMKMMKSFIAYFCMAI